MRLIRKINSIIMYNVPIYFVQGMLFKQLITLNFILNS